MAPLESNQPLRFAKIASIVVLLGAVVLFGSLFYRVMSTFLLPLFLAALLVVVFAPAYRWLQRKMPAYPKVAAGLATGLIVAVILVPLIWALGLAVKEGVDLAQGSDWSQLREQFSGFRKTFGLDLPMAADLEAMDSLVDTLHEDPPPRISGEASLQLASRAEKLQRLVSRLQSKLQLSRQGEGTRGGIPAARAIQVEAQLEFLKATATDLVHWFDEWLGQDRGEDTLPRSLDDEAIDEYRLIATRLDVRYHRFRQELLGGSFRSWFMELANPSPDRLRAWQDQVTGYLRHWLVTFTGQTTAILGGFLLGLGIMVISIFYFFLDGSTMVRALMRLSPLDDRHEEKLLAEFSSISRAVVLASLLSALAQGALATIGYLVTGAHPLFLLVVLTTVLALVPFVGAAAVWVPVSLWLVFMEHRTAAGIGLAIYGALVVSMVDNFVKPYVLHGQSNIHPLLGLLSVLGGVQALGPVGILVGPMLVAFFQALLQMLRQEVVTLDRA